MGRRNRIKTSAAHVGDMVQVTKVEIGGSDIELELNGGFKTGPKWHERISLGMGTRQTPISQGSQPTAGTIVSLASRAACRRWKSRSTKNCWRRCSISRSEVPRKITWIRCLRPFKQQSRRSPPGGMDRDQVVMAMGKPRHKQRRDERRRRVGRLDLRTAARQDHLRDLRGSKGQQGQRGVRRLGWIYCGAAEAELITISVNIKCNRTVRTH